MPSAPIVVTYDQPIEPSSVTPSSLVVHGMQTGQLAISARVESDAADKIAAVLSNSLHPGELVQVTVTTQVENVRGQAAEHAVVWQFRTAPSGGSGALGDSGQRLGHSSSLSVGLGDVDGDGDLDALVGNGSSVGGQFQSEADSRVWLNDGRGQFTDSGQRLSGSAAAVALGDLDGDGDLDAFVAASSSDTFFSPGAAPNRVWLNDGGGRFTDTGQRLGLSPSLSLALGDVDGDGDLDAVVGDAFSGSVWLNDGRGQFHDSGQSLAKFRAAVALGDLDGDGDLDVFAAASWQNPWGPQRFPDTIWLNDGQGVFSDSGQNLGDAASVAVSLGDLDGDADIDAVVANLLEPSTLWLNDGLGSFSNSGQTLGPYGATAVELGDIDGDSDLDMITTHVFDSSRQTTVWVNSGQGQFHPDAYPVDWSGWDVALGDLDTDGDLDLFVANGGFGDQPNTVWFNQNADNRPPAVAMMEVVPDPRLQDVEQVMIVFDEPVLGLDLSDFALKRNGGANLLPGGAGLSTVDGRNWILDNLSPLTGQPGRYEINLTAADAAITDLAGNPLQVSAKETWTDIRQAGDANLDGQFDTDDLVSVLVAQST